MCNHVYAADYKQKPLALGKRCPNPELYEKAQSTALEPSAPALPIDDLGRCLFHSRDSAWKRANDFAGQFQHLVRSRIADTTAPYYDFAEFVFVGGELTAGSGPSKLHVVDAVFLKKAYFTAASFLDSLALDRVDFRGGADFSHATFAGDLLVTDAGFNSLELTGAKLEQRVWFTRVDLRSYAGFSRAGFTGSTGAGPLVKFEDSRFDAITDFSAATFVLGDESSVGFLRTRFDDAADFTGARFHCQLVFNDVVFAGLTEFIDSSFDTIRSAARYRGRAVEFNRVEVAAGAVLRFVSTDPQKRMFDHDVQMSFKETPAGLIHFENVNFNNIDVHSRERLTQLARLGRVEIGPGCIKYRFQTPILRIDVSEGNAPLILKLCQTFANYFTVSNGLNLGLEIVERTSTSVHYFFFTDEDISEATFFERLELTAAHMWSLLGVRSSDEIRALEAPVTPARAARDESMLINAVDSVTAMMALFFGVGARIALGRWSEADTRALRRAIQFRDGDEDPELAHALHVVLVDRYTGATLFDLNNRQHAGLPPMILAYRDDPTIDAIDFAIVTALEVERRAVCEVFGLTDEHRVRRGSRVYWRGTLPLGDGKAYELVVVQAPDAANVDAAILTNDLLHHWQPGAALLVGIAATVDAAKARLGDVVVAREVYYYERGKVTSEGMRPEPKIIAADATLWSNVEAVPDWSGTVGRQRPDGTDARSRVHAGVIASGEKVIADGAVRDEIAAGHRKILAIEMEGYGFSRAVWQSFEHVRHLVVRSISDDGSKDKNDGWHVYASAAAAGFVRHFLMDRPLDQRHGLARQHR